MPDQDVRAQLVMKREDGTSILDADRQRAATAGSFDVSEDRAQAIRRQLAALGFEVEAGNLNTLSISGPPELFARTFGMGAEPGAHAAEMPEALADKVADVFVPPAPQFFP